MLYREAAPGPGMPETDVLIVGAGPTGLTLACELARRGVACRLVERADDLFLGSRAKGLQPRTLEVLEILGVADAIRAGGAPFPCFRLYAGSEVRWERSLEEMLGTPMPCASAAVPHPRPWLIPQWRTDQILRDRFLELGGRVEFSTAVTGLVHDEFGATVTLERPGALERVRARFVVGADGGRSIVRKSCGFSFEGETLATETTLIGDAIATGLDGEACHILTRDGAMSSRFSLWNLPGSPLYQFVAALPPEGMPELTLDAVQQLLEARSGRTDIRLSDMRWISVYRINVRMVDRLRKGPVLLAGDAAHVHSSAGGQGLNTGIQDAFNLGWKLAAVVAGAPESLLDTYDEERLPVAARVLGLTSRLHRQDFGPPDGSQPAIHQLDISYRGSSLSVESGDQDAGPHGSLRAGDRAPDGVVRGGARVFELLRQGRFVLLAFGRPDLPEIGSVTSATVEGRLEGYDVADGTLVLVRPDGHVGAITRSLAVVQAYLSKLSAQ
ncbi:FAD-dependent monooxygenase [Nannocystis sp. SCPEA4]|uniref:FAD-dependent monooxygenase n=1 Tax=Nannocystis sp. SCPEA4 TaxID=2996787 RepID=UPI00226FD42C|nr:FAD-dependent monooxygenase [Nannocystis sp. SCPEA4]MCY1056790.1 FAD-dependent monooxygenase [Nannocystis sp. SCPEA4]